MLKKIASLQICQSKCIFTWELHWWCSGPPSRIHRSQGSRLNPRHQSNLKKTKSLSYALRKRHKVDVCTVSNPVAIRSSGVLHPILVPWLTGHVQDILRSWPFTLTERCSKRSLFCFFRQLLGSNQRADERELPQLLPSRVFAQDFFWSDPKASQGRLPLRPW